MSFGGGGARASGKHVVRGKSGLRVVGSLEVVTGHLNN